MQFESTRTMKMNSAVQQLVRFNARRKDTVLPCAHRIIASSSGAHLCEEDELIQTIRPTKEVQFYLSLTNCGVRDNPSLARAMTSVVPASRRARRHTL